jgi:transposase
VLQAVFRFRQQQGSGYYSTRLLSHFLLHCECGLKVAQIARLLGIARPTASKQQGMSAKAAIQQAHHRMKGRAHGKLLPRYAGPIAAFLLGHPQASRAELIDFVAQSFGVRVSRIALYKFLKKYGLNNVADSAQPSAPANPAGDVWAASPQESPAAAPTPAPAPGVAPAPPIPSALLALPAPVIELASVVEFAKLSAPPFSSDGRNTPAPSC